MALAPGHAHCSQLKFCTLTIFCFRDNLYRDTAPVPIYQPSSIETIYRLLIKLIPRHSECSIKFVPGLQKHVPYLPCHRDNFPAKGPGLCPVLSSGNTTSLYCRAVRLPIDQDRSSYNFFKDLEISIFESEFYRSPNKSYLQKGY